MILKYFDCSQKSYINISTENDIQRSILYDDANTIIYGKQFSIENNIELKCGIAINDCTDSIDFIFGIISIPDHISSITIEYSLCCKEAMKQWKCICTIQNNKNNLDDDELYNDDLFNGFNNNKVIDVVGWPSDYLSIKKALKYNKLIFGCDIKLILVTENTNNFYPRAPSRI